MDHATRSELRGGEARGYRAIGDYGDGNHIYYFGRTKLGAAYAMSLEGPADGVHERQKRMLRKKCRRVGLGRPSRVLLWGRSEDVDKDWDALKMILRGHTQDDMRLTNELLIGDNWFSCEDHGPDALGTWLRAVWDNLQRRVPAAEEYEEQPPVDEEYEEQPPVVEVFRDSSLLVNRLLELRDQNQI